MFSTSRPPGQAPAPTSRARVRGRAAPASAVLVPLGAVLTGVALLLASQTARAQSLDDRWYVGLGGGAALLRPDAASSAIDVDEGPTGSATVLFGRDLDERSSVQLQLHGLGEAALERDGSPVDDGVAYTAADASVLYRFFDSRDRAPRGTVFGASLYGRFGLGLMHRESDVDLENDADVNFGAGAGIEVYLTRSLALRAEGIFHDRDAGSANLSLVARFGGRRSTLPPPVPVEPASTRTAPVPTAPVPTPSAPTATPVPPVVDPAPVATPIDPATVAPDAPSTSAPDASPPSDPSTLPETFGLPREGSSTDAAVGSTPGAPSGVSTRDAPLPDPSTLPETFELPPAAPSPDAAPGGAPVREAPIKLPEAPLPDVPSPGSPPPATPSADAPLPDAATLPETFEAPPVDAPGTAPRPEAAPTPAPAPPPEPAPSPAPTTAPAPDAPPVRAGTPGDADGDGVADAADTCPGSAPGFPVRDNGCALLDGVLSGLRFAPGTAELAPGASEQLDYLATLLNDYPDARVELLAHTDDAGSVREQSILSRARLRTLGTYLVQRGGVRANRLVLRSFGGTRPLYDNRTAEGRAANNRIEILERTNPGR